MPLLVNPRSHRLIPNLHPHEHLSAGGQHPARVQQLKPTFECLALVENRRNIDRPNPEEDLPGAGSKGCEQRVCRVVSSGLEGL